MAPDPRGLKALKTMQSLGLPGSKVKPILKELLRNCEKNWELIEADNYSVLVDAIFSAEDVATEEKKNRGKRVNNDFLEEEENAQEPERPLKRLRLRGREVDRSPPELLESRTQCSQVSPSNAVRNKGKEPLVVEERSMPERVSRGLFLKEPGAASGIILAKNSVGDGRQLIEPKDEPFMDDMFMGHIPQYETPIAVIHPDSISQKKPATVEHNESRKAIDPVRGREVPIESAPETQSGDEPSYTLDVAASSLGEVKLFLSCNSAVGRRQFRLPTLDAVIKMAEEKCLHLYKITDPNFSVKNLMRDVCESFLKLGTDSANEPQDQHPNGTVHVSSNLDAPPNGSTVSEHGGENAVVTLQTPNEPPDSIEAPVQASEETVTNALGGVEENLAVLILNEPVDVCREDQVHTCKKTPESISTVERTIMCDSMVVSELERAQDLRSLDDVQDITRGEEWVQVPWINEINYDCPPSFRYISQGLVFQSAKLDVSLSRIRDSSCCPTCLGDCLSASVPCACAQETGGEFAYTTEGAVKEGFLEDSISMARDPHYQCLQFCKQCPLEKSKNDDCLDPCKGHLKRKFIKECWMKCGCTKKCGNRVVQRGITRNLQVFFTSDERGWGLRTLEELPKGTFVCEYAGEILTTMESSKRNVKCDKSRKDTYLALLDADWGSSEGTLKDDKALCLDAAQYGNVARFINHRCLDANLIEIPVEVETPDHHYYHFAFFTTRKVDPMEELTWDYGIDFDDHDNSIKPFSCRCGSKFCRNIKRQNRTKLTVTGS